MPQWSGLNPPIASRQGPSQRPQERRLRWVWVLGSIGSVVVFVTYVAVFVFGGLRLISGFFPFDQLAMERPELSDLVGTYHLTESSERYLLHRKHYEYLPDVTIELRADSTLSITNLPDCALQALGEANGFFHTAEGTWEMREDWIGYSITVRIEEGGKIDAMIYSNWLTIRRTHPPYLLQITIGDPDSGDSLFYELSSDQTAGP